MKYIIRGGNPLSGKLQASGNKNAALPCLVATLLTDEPITLQNIPDLQDVRIMIKILEKLGVKVQQESKHCYHIHAATITSAEVPYELATKMRASILFAGALLARCGEAVFFQPGGDDIGRRRIDTHIHSLHALNTEYSVQKSAYRMTTKALKGTSLLLDEASVTGTENTLMAAVLSEGITTIENAACEPHVQDLCNMLNAMGARISGIGSNILTIEGVKKLHGVDFCIGPDFMEVGSFIGLAGATRSELEITHAEPLHLRMCALMFQKLGLRWESSKDSIFIPKKQDMKVQVDMNNAIPIISDAPWPGFPPDLTSISVVLATQVHGVVLIHEKMFESRLYFVDKLKHMGAHIVLCDPHRAVVSGPSHLHGTALISPDVRAGMAMVIAALCAEGESEINNIYEIERGYEQLSARLSAVGADIQKQD